MAPFLFILCLTPLLIAAIQMVMVRVVRLLGLGLSNQLVVILCAAAGAVPMGAALWGAYIGGPGLAFSEAAVASLYSLVVYALLAYTYFHLFNMSETARRIRILREIHAAGSLSAEEIAGRYSAEAIFANRIERLLAAGQIREVGGGRGEGGGHDDRRYVLSGRLLYTAALVLAFWGRVLGAPGLGERAGR